MESYRIADEPRPGGLASCVVYPFWPLFGFMFGGAWLSWPWFILNGVAVGSPTLHREVALVVGGFVGSAVLAALIMLSFAYGILPESAFHYVVLALTVWKLGICYWLYTLQGRTFGIYEYYGGQVKNGLFPFLIALFIARRGLFSFIDTDTASGIFLTLVLF